LGPLEGVFAAAVTPRRPDTEEIDLAAFWELIDFLSSKQLSGIVLMGSTGEFVHFSLEERKRMIGLAVKRSRVPVIVNVSHTALDCAAELGSAAIRAGARALLLMPPYYFRYGREDLGDFFRLFLAESGGGAPVLLYNIPAFTSPMEPQLASALLREGYAGIKDSSGDWANFEALLPECRAAGASLLVGSDALFARARRAGADGVVSGTASAFPELLVAIDRAIADGRQELASTLESRLAEMIARMDSFPAPVGVREAVRARGLNPGAPAIDLTGERARQCQYFREWFAGWFPGVLAECGGA
jgi:4-hydroxy-tetrahydrodipicolinate synthase